MRLHLPKALLAAVLAACLARPAGATDYIAECRSGNPITCGTGGATSGTELTTPTVGDKITFKVTGGYLFDANNRTKAQNTIAADLEINSFVMNNGFSGEGTTAWYYFTGSVSGNGPITRTALQNSLGFSFSGDMAEYCGKITIGGRSAGEENILSLGAIQVGKSEETEGTLTVKAGEIDIQSKAKLQLAGTTIWGNVSSIKTEIGAGLTTFHGSLTNKTSGTLTSNGAVLLNQAFTNYGSATLGGSLHNTADSTFSNTGTVIIDGILVNSGTFSNEGAVTINGSYTGKTITQTRDSATLTLASNSKVNMGSMTASFGTERDDSASGLQSYTASYTIADGGTITDNGAVFRVGGENFTGTLSDDGVYTITESRYNILAGETKSMQNVVNEIGVSASYYYINVIGSSTEGGADGILTGVSNDTLTHGISGNGIIQVDTDTSLSYSKIFDKAVEFTGSISVLGTLTGVVDSALPHTIQGVGTVQVDENDTLSYAAFKKKASEFTGSINVVGLLSGVTDSSLTHTVTGTGAIQVDTGDTLSYSKINEKAGSFSGSINVLGTLTGVSDSSLTHTITGDGFVQVDSGTSLSYTTLTEKGASFSGVIRLDGGNFIINQNDAGISRPLLVTENSSLKLNGSSTWAGFINAVPEKVLSVSLADGATSGTLKLNGQTSKLSGAVLQIESGVNVSVDGSGGTAYIGGAVTVKAGGTFTLNGNDALGYDGGQTPSITLAGSAPVEGSELAKYAILDLGTTEQIMQTALNLNGYAKITGSEGGAFNSWSNNGSNFSKITVNGDHNEITCGVLVRQGLEVSVSEKSSLEISGTVSPKASGQSNAGFKKTGLGLLTIMGDTSMNKQLQVEAGTMKISGYTNSLTGAVTVSTGATLEFARGTTTISSVVSGGGVIKVSGGTVTLNGNNTYTNETRLSGGEIQAGKANAFGTGKLIVDGTSNISGTATIGDYIAIEGNVVLTIKENSAITLGNAGTDKGMWVKAGSSVVLENGASVTGYGVTVSHLNENSKLAAESGGEGQFGISGQLNEEKLTIKESAISLADKAVLRNKLDGGTVSSTGSTTIGWLDENGTHGGGSISSLADTSASDTLEVASDLAVTKSAAIAGTLNIGEKATAAINSAREDDTASSIGTLTGSGTLKATGGKTKVTNASGFSGTLAATGGNIELQMAEALTLSEVVVDNGSSISGATSYTVDEVSIGKGAAGSLVGNLSIKANGTITLDASDGATTETGGTKGLSLSALTTTFADDGNTTTTGSLTLGSGLTLNLLNLDVEQDIQVQSLTLFSGVTSAVYGDDATKLTANGIDARTVFTNLTEGDYKLTFDETNHIVALVAQEDVPEPTTATLSLLALMGLAARRRRRKA